MSNKKKKNQVTLGVVDVTSYILKIFVSAFACLIFIAMPLITHDKYYDIGDFKYKMFMVISVYCLAFCLLVVFVYFVMQITKKKINFKSLCETVKSFSVLDWFVIAFFIVSVLSYCFSPYKTNVFHFFSEEMENLPWDGYQGWNMGLRSQIIFVLLYFLVSRCFMKSWKNDFLGIMLGCAFCVFFLGVLHRFYIDPFEFYNDLEDHYKLKFLSTLGQSTWYSSFMVVVLPIGSTLFLFNRERQSVTNILLGIFVAIGAATFVTQNSDSAYLPFAALVIISFAVSFSDNYRFLKFWEMMIIMLGAFKVVGVFQMLFPERVPSLDKLSFFMSKSVFTWILLAVVIVLYVVFYKLDANKKLDITKFKLIRNIIVAVAIACVPLGVLIAYFNTKGMINIEAIKNAEYFVFNDKWGNSRGYTWKSTITAMKTDEWKKLMLLGPGPDCYFKLVYSLEPLATEMYEYWNHELVVCCHNEWLNMLFNEGILGLISYLGIFVSAAVAFGKKKDNPLMIGGLIAIVSYFFHNLFCYQQILCTPMIFIIIGFCECFRREKNVENNK